MMKTLNADDMRDCILDHIGEQSHNSWARKNGISGCYLSQILTGKREPTKAVLKIIGYRKIACYAACNSEKEDA
jgi:hypothetical protein